MATTNVPNSPTTTTAIISGCATDTRCGSNWTDANAKCGQCCVHNGDCTITNEKCFAHLNTAICAPTTDIPQPTQPDELLCGDSATGSYSDGFLTFNVQMAYYSDLTFNASQSTFHVTTIEAYSKLNVALGQDTEHDEILTLFNHPPGDYKFIIDGASDGTYNIQITCTSDGQTPYLTEIISTTETNSFSLILIGMVCGLFCIICCLLVLAILIINNHYKRKSGEHVGINEGMEHTVIDNVLEGIDNKIVPNKSMVDCSVDIEGLPLPNSVKSTVNEPMHLQNNISTCTEMESMYGSVQNTKQHIQTTKLAVDLNTIDQLNENYNDEEEYEYEYYDE